MHEEQHELVIDADVDGLRLDQAVAARLPQYSRAAIRRWIDAGQVALNGAAVKPRVRVRSGDNVVVNARLDASEALRPQAVAFDVVHADDNLLVVAKPAGKKATKKTAAQRSTKKVTKKRAPKKKA